MVRQFDIGRSIPEVNSVGFTGTSVGMTILQANAVFVLLQQLRPDVVHHGDCLGADHHFDIIAETLGIRRVAHPCHLRGREPKTYRAFCQAEQIHKPQAPLTRNRGIVSRCSTMIVAPRQPTEQQRSGTWATYRYAKAAECRVIVVRPDGSVKEE